MLTLASMMANISQHDVRTTNYVTSLERSVSKPQTDLTQNFFISKYILVKQLTCQ